MDRSDEFLAIVANVGPTVGNSPLIGRLAPSPLILRAVEMLKQISKFDSLIKSCFEEYVGYHRFLPVSYRGKSTTMTEKDRYTLNQEVLLFIGAIATEIQSMNKYVENSDLPTISIQHYNLVVSFLFNKLNELTKLFEKMQLEKKMNYISPYRLLTESTDYNSFEPLPDSEKETESNNSSNDSSSYYGESKDNSNSTNAVGTELSKRNSTGSIEQLKSKNTSTVPRPSSVEYTSSNSNFLSELSQKILNKPTVKQNKIDDNFAKRYEDEIAPVSKMKEYEEIATKQKESLMKEAKRLHIKYSNDMEESLHMESTVNNISSLIMDFVQLIEAQSEKVEDLNAVSKNTTESVRSTDRELLLTLERTQSHQYSMIIFIIFLSFLLLVLDLIAP